MGHLKTWCGAARTPKKTKNNKAGVGTPHTGATLGHRGAACTAPDAIWRILLQTMLNGGTYGNRRIFSRAACRHNDARSKRSTQCALGNRLGRNPERECGDFWGDLVSQQTFGHTGATGTVAWADARAPTQLRRAHQSDGRRRKPSATGFQRSRRQQ